MIKLIAFVFLIVNGAVADTPTASFSYRDTFDTVQACEAQRGSDANKAAVDELHATIAENNPGVDFSIETKCVPTDEDDDAK